jgi:alpha-N-acetylglucosamine transferase
MNEKDMENIDKIILKCENENEDYLKPEKMRDSNGNNIYAYVTLVMLGDAYISAAIVLAQSLINSGSEADRVVMVTNDVTEEGKQILSMFFNHVIPITYIEIPNWRTEKQTWRKYLNLVFTKFHIFNLTQYKKIILIDADAIILKHPDHIFSLNAPAGCFLEDKDLFIFYNKDGSYRLPDGPIPWYEKFCDIAPHGSLIPKEFTDRIKTNFKNSGIGGGLMLLEPKLGEFDDIIHNVSHGEMKYLIEKKFVWPEQQYLTLRYSGLWHNINPRFFGLQGYPHWKVLYGLQYGGDKPFQLNSKMPIEERLKYDDYILWHDIYRDILNSKPELVESPVLKEVNQLASLFLKNKKLNMSRSNKGNEYREYYARYNLKLIYKDDPIHRTQQSYYQSDRFSTYNGLNPDVMFPDIAEYDYLQPISLLNEYYGKNNFYSTILKDDITFDKRGLHKFNYFDNDIRDEIMLQYTKCRKDMYIITLWPLAHELGMDKIDEFIKILEELGIVAYVKTIGMNKNTIKNIMFWMYNEFTFQARIDFIKEKLVYSHVLDDNNPVTFIFFDNTKKLQINGQNSKDKKMLREKLLKLLNKNEDKNIRGNDVIHINDYFYQTVEYSQMILNKNTLHVLKEQSVDRMINGFFSDSNLKYQTFRNALYSNFSLLEISRIIVIGGLVLYAYGLRKFTDIDAILSLTQSAESESEYEKYLESIIYDNFVSKDTKIPFIDLQKEDSKHWKESLTKKNNDLFNAVNIKSTIDLVTNPSNHFYFQGIKLYKLQTEVLRKFMRIRDSNIHNKNKDLMDFMMICTLNDGLMSEFINYNYDKKEFKINKKYEEYIGTDKIKIDQIQELKKIAEKYYLRLDIKLL